MIPESGDGGELAIISAYGRSPAVRETVEEKVDFRDEGLAILSLARKRGMQVADLNRIAEAVLRETRAIGAWLVNNGPERGGDPMSCRTTLESLGLSRDQSSRWQKIARIPESDFERYIAVTKEVGDEITTVGAFRLAQQLLAVPAEPRPLSLEAVDSRINNWVGSLVEKVPGEFRGPIAARLQSLSEAIRPDPDLPDEAIPAIRIVASSEAPATAPLRSPFPWFGAKSRVAEEVWARFGDCPNYVEPFAGSLAVLLARPHAPRVETVNDLNCFVANFFRAVARDPVGVADHARWPVNEVDLEARHWWLVNGDEAQKFRKAMRTDPEHFDRRVAGWWAWGQCNWIGSGWCEHADSVDLNPAIERHPRKARPDLGGTGKGVVSMARASTPGRDRLLDYLLALADRLRNVRVCCGDWERICGPAPTTGLGLTAAFLDPPYLTSAGRYPDLYASDSRDVAHEVREWALARGDDPLFRIALCGYEGEHAVPDSWECFSWEASGGYAAPKRNGSNDNARRERIWFSPHCLRPSRDRSLFDSLTLDSPTMHTSGG